MNNIGTDRRLLRALRRSAEVAGCAVMLSHESETPWASATFVGGRHQVEVTGEALDAWLAALPGADLPMNGHFVASCDVERRGGGAMLTLLMLEA